MSFCLFFPFADAAAVRNVVLTIEPAVVQRFHESIIRCQYDMENEPLYTVKWYRGTKEFYRFSPKDEPKTRKFDYLNIKVDVSNNNNNHIQINLSKNIIFFAK